MSCKKYISHQNIPVVGQRGPPGHKGQTGPTGPTGPPGTVQIEYCQDSTIVGTDNKLFADYVAQHSGIMNIQCGLSDNGFINNLTVVVGGISTDIFSKCYFGGTINGFLNVIENQSVNIGFVGEIGGTQRANLSILIFY